MNLDGKIRTLEMIVKDAFEVALDVRVHDKNVLVAFDSFLGITERILGKDVTQMRIFWGLKATGRTDSSFLEKRLWGMPQEKGVECRELFLIKGDIDAVFAWREENRGCVDWPRSRVGKGCDLRLSRRLGAGQIKAAFAIWLGHHVAKGDSGWLVHRHVDSRSSRRSEVKVSDSIKGCWGLVSFDGDTVICPGFHGKDRRGRSFTVAGNGQARLVKAPRKSVLGIDADHRDNGRGRSGCWDGSCHGGHCSTSCSGIKHTQAKIITLYYFVFTISI